MFFYVYGLGVKDFTCNIYGLVFNVRVLIFCAWGLGLRV